MRLFAFLCVSEAEQAHRLSTDLKLCPCYAGRVEGDPAIGRTTPRKSRPVDAVAALRDFAIKLYDKGDGRGVDWSKTDQAAFWVAFCCLREPPPGDKDLQRVRAAPRCRLWSDGGLAGQ